MKTKKLDPVRRAYEGYFQSLWKIIYWIRDEAFKAAEACESSYKVVGIKLSPHEMVQLMLKLANLPKYRSNYAKFPKREFDEILSEVEIFLKDLPGGKFKRPEILRPKKAA